MEEKEVTIKAFSNMIWRFAESSGSRIITLVVSMILARILEPEDYGCVTLIIAVNVVLQVIMEGGIGTALVQKKDADELDYSTAHSFYILSSVFVYLLTFLIAPVLAKMYEIPELSGMIRVYSICILLLGIKSIYVIYVFKNLEFKKNFRASLTGTIVAAVVSIVLALSGAGAWALIAQYVIDLLVDTLFLRVVLGWKPGLRFSAARWKQLMNYGWKILMTNILDVVYNNLAVFVIGKIYTSSQLAYYDKGKQIPNMLNTDFEESVDRVMMTMMSQQQDDKKALKILTQRTIKVSCYVFFPVMMGIAACAPAFIEILLTEKWLSCVPFLQLFCLYGALKPLLIINATVIKAKGRSGYYLKIQLIKKIVGFAGILFFARYGVMAIAVSFLVLFPFEYMITAYPNRDMIEYSPWEQIKDMLPSGIMTALMFTGAYALNYARLIPWATMAVQIVTGVMIYVLLSIMTKNENYIYVRDFLKKYLKRA